MNERCQTVLLFGPPGVGKGTQGEMIGRVSGFHHLSTGDMFRNIDAESEAGKIFHAHASRGELVPDEVTIDIWRDHVAALTAQDRYRAERDLLVLDGVPRSLNQVQLMKSDIAVLQIIHLVCEDVEAMIERLRQRAAKEGRTDDAREDVVRHRWEVYREQTQPVLDCYSPDLIAAVDAMGTPDEVQRRILAILVPVQETHFPNAPA